MSSIRVSSTLWTDPTPWTVLDGLLSSAKSSTRTSKLTRNECRKAGASGATEEADHYSEGEGESCFIYHLRFIHSLFIPLINRLFIIPLSTSDTSCPPTGSHAAETEVCETQNLHARRTSSSKFT